MLGSTAGACARKIVRDIIAECGKTTSVSSKGPDVLRRGRGVVLDVARGLHYLHTNKMVHFDVKVGPESHHHTSCIDNSLRRWAKA